MEASGGGVSPQASRKQWRQRNEELERSQMGQSDERLIYEVQLGREQGIDAEQRLHSVVNQREELQQIELELRAQLAARNMITEMKSRFDAQIKEHATTSTLLQDQLREKDHMIVDLERMLEEKERELHAAWAKEDLLREQNKELQTFRRERDNSESERVQQMKQIHDLQEHIQEKERQFMELQEQNRIAQEAIVFKDERLREAQNWISQVQEMDALQSCTNHSLQAELRERTEQYNQLWLGCRQQYGEMERLHHHIQQLQHELAEARGKNGTSHEGPLVLPTISRDILENGVASCNSGVLPSTGTEIASPTVSVEASSIQSDHVHGIQVAPTSLFGFPSYFPPEQVSPFIMHQAGGPPLGSSQVPQSHATQFQSVPAMSALQQWQNQQAASESLPTSTDGQYSLPAESGLLRPELNYSHESSVNGLNIQSDYVDVSANPSINSNTVGVPSKENREDYETVDSNYFTDNQPQKSMHQISSHFHDALRLNSHEENNHYKVENLMSEQSSADSNSSLAKTSAHVMNFSNLTSNAVSDAAAVPDTFSSTGQRDNLVEEQFADTSLLDERLLLACIARTIPPGSGGRIRISSTLPNRLGKMLAPLHWHDYKRKYGKLDDFVTSHPKLFVVDGDYIQLREGAQETIAKNAAVAKVAAAAAATSPLSSLFPSVAVTPMAHSTRVAGVVPNSKILTKAKDHMGFNGSEVNSSVMLAVVNGTKSGRNELGSPQNKISIHAATNVIGKQKVNRSLYNC